ncbi:calmodulin binding transcription activator [Trichuris trichiura]|uniref:Calmodulin binding transcription activator n=1 Tax=Trichuris trichiura TaxID=36087 RepID=A0A077Z497_TRITR|nr:calmodulin binding transcription activator [Trichuris trichiura]
MDFQKLAHHQQQLGEAAKIIQNAYRHYRERLRSKRQSETEYRAAVLIQSYYRRYRQHRHFKRMHRAAAYIQKQFREKKCKLHRLEEITMQYTTPTEDTKSSPSLLLSQQSGILYVKQKPMINILMDKRDLLFLRQTLAAMRIQHAFRNHRQRRVVSRIIQKLINISKLRMKLRKFYEIDSKDKFDQEPRED